MRITAGYIWTDYKTNTEIAKGLNINPPRFVQNTGIQKKLFATYSHSFISIQS